jgi:hypothetical protein
MMGSRSSPSQSIVSPKPPPDRSGRHQKSAIAHCTRSKIAVGNIARPWFIRVTRHCPAPDSLFSPFEPEPSSGVWDLRFRRARLIPTADLRTPSPPPSRPNHTALSGLFALLAVVLASDGWPDCSNAWWTFRYTVTSGSCSSRRRRVFSSRSACLGRRGSRKPRSLRLASHPIIGGRDERIDILARRRFAFGCAPRAVEDPFEAVSSRGSIATKANARLAGRTRESHIIHAPPASHGRKSPSIFPSCCCSERFFQASRRP